MRVLIADDERLARANLKSILKNLSIPIKVVGEASNGEELVELVKQYLPDVAFVDIRMPKVNGLEAIKVAKNFSPDTKWFILTGFSEFDYAKEAIRLGTVDYLLKPISPDELDGLLHKVDEDYRRQHFSLNKQFERDIMALYHGVSSLQQEPGDSYLLQANFIGAVFYVDSHLSEKAKAERQKELFQKIRAYIDESVANNLRIALFALPNGEIALVVAWIDKTSGKHTAERFLDRVEETVQLIQADNFKITVLQTDQCGSYESLNEHMEHLQELAHLRTVEGIGAKWEIRALEKYAKSANLVNLSQLLGELSEAYREVNYLDFMRLLPRLEKMLTALLRQADNSLKEQIASFLNTALCCQISANQPVSAWRAILDHCGEQLLSQAKGIDQPDLVSQVVTFIDTHYQFDIGVAQIADQLKITPNYLSTIFHRKMGTTFVHYLTQIRMLKAKEFLADPTLQVQQIAESVGYYNTRYFTKLFTEFAGCTPSEFRRIQTSREGNLDERF
jgi:two-component system response regulator YesN